MRILLAALVGVVLAGATEEAAAGRYYPWCAQYLGERGASSNCGFDTHAQCLADVRGVGGYCHENPFNRQWAAEPPPPRKYRHRRVQPY